MQIFVREHKVRTQRVTSLLRSKLHERFTPRHTAPGVYADIEMGFNTEVRLIGTQLNSTLLTDLPQLDVFLIPEILGPCMQGLKQEHISYALA